MRGSKVPVQAQSSRLLQENEGLLVDVGIELAPVVFLEEVLVAQRRHLKLQEEVIGQVLHMPAEEPAAIFRVTEELAATAAQQVGALILNAPSHQGAKVGAGQAGKIRAHVIEVGAHRRAAIRQVIDIAAPTRADHRLDAE